MSDRPGSFAEALRRAIDERGLSLHRIQDHLAVRGVAASSATLSYWQSGRSRPGRASSRDVVPHLEAVLQLEPGELMRFVPPTRERRRRSAVRGLDALWPEPPHAAVLRRLDTSWDADLDRLSVHDLLRIGPDRRQLSLAVRQTMRARVDGPDRRVVMHVHDDTTVGLPNLRAIRGCRLGPIAYDESAGVLGAELLFFQPLSRGETVVVEYELVHPRAGPQDQAYTRRLRLPMREFLLEVEFDAAARPESVTAFSETREALIDLDEAHRAHLVHTDSTPGTTGIRWSWPTVS